MVQPQPDYSLWEQIPEEMIVQAAEMAGEMGPDAEGDNLNFRRVLLAGKMFRVAGLTPIFVWHQPTNKLAVYAQETYGKKLH